MSYHQRGFSLIEIAISLIIMGLLLGGIVIPISDSFKNAQARSNGDRLLAARESIMGFAIANQRLPCPTDSWNGSNAGLEPTFCSLNLKNYESTSVNKNQRNTSGVISGVLPWKTLGMQRDDSFGNPIYYTVERRLTFAENSSNATTPSDDSLRNLALNSGNLSEINIYGRDENNNNRRIELAKNVAVVLTTLGRYNANVSPSAVNDINALIPAGDERVNAQSCCATLPYKTDSTTRNFYTRTLSTDPQTKDDTGTVIGSFDDQILWIPFYQLVGVMTQAGRLQ